MKLPDLPMICGPAASSGRAFLEEITNAFKEDPNLTNLLMKAGSAT